MEMYEIVCGGKTQESHENLYWCKKSQKNYAN